MAEQTPVTESQRSAMRADAEQNRARIIEVARTALAASSDASLNAIAKLASVGPGTLYRHFPNREALLLAVYRQDVRELIDAVPVLLAGHPPVAALRLWIERLAAYGRIKHSLADAMQAATRADLAGEHYGQVITAITLLLDAGKGSGDLRPDIDADELLLLVSFLWRTDVGAGGDVRSRHLLDLVMDGLRWQPDTGA